MRKYPLDPLKRVRADKVEQETRSLSESLGRVEKARTAAEQREHAKREHERALREALRAEREKLEQGELTVADLARGAAFGIAGEMKRAVHTRVVEEARAEHYRATTEAKAKQTNLAHARAEADVVDKHHDKWKKERAAEVLAREEESAEEAHLARRRDGGRQ